MRPVPTKFIFWVLIPNASEASKGGGPGAAPGKIFAPTPFRSLESAHFCKEVAIERSGRTLLMEGFPGKYLKQNLKIT